MNTNNHLPTMPEDRPDNYHTHHFYEKKQPLQQSRHHPYSHTNTPTTTPLKIPYAHNEANYNAFMQNTHSTTSHQQHLLQQQQLYYQQQQNTTTSTTAGGNGSAGYAALLFAVNQQSQNDENINNTLVNSSPPHYYPQLSQSIPLHHQDYPPTFSSSEHPIKKYDCPRVHCTKVLLNK